MPSRYYFRRATYLLWISRVRNTVAYSVLVICWWHPWLATACWVGAAALLVWHKPYGRSVLAAAEATQALLEQRGVCGKLHRRESGLVYGCELPALHQGRCSPVVEVTAAVKAQEE